MANRTGRLVPKRGHAVELAEEQHTAQAKLRAAVFNAVSEEDIRETIEAIVTRAKQGDKIALKYLFDYILGGRVTTAIQNNVYIDGRREPDEPTDALPGTRRKLDVLSQRAGNGQRLFHAEDSKR